MDNVREAIRIGQATAGKQTALVVAAAGFYVASIWIVLADFGIELCGRSAPGLYDTNTIAGQFVSYLRLIFEPLNDWVVDGHSGYYVLDKLFVILFGWFICRAGPRGRSRQRQTSRGRSRSRGRSGTRQRSRSRSRRNKSRTVRSRSGGSRRRSARRGSRGPAQRSQSRPRVVANRSRSRTRGGIDLGRNTRNRVAESFRPRLLGAALGVFGSTGKPRRVPSILKGSSHDVTASVGKEFMVNEIYDAKLDAVQNLELVSRSFVVTKTNPFVTYGYLYSTLMRLSKYKELKAANSVSATVIADAVTVKTGIEKFRPGKPFPLVFRPPKELAMVSAWDADPVVAVLTVEILARGRDLDDDMVILRIDKTTEFRHDAPA